MKLVPQYIESQFTKALTRRVTDGGLRVVPPIAWNLAAAIPRFRDRRAILWRVNEIELSNSPVSELGEIWNDVLQGTSWAIPPQAVVWLWAYLQRVKPTRILELGSGVSTLTFGAYASRHGRSVRVVSVEHEKDWIDVLAKRLSELKLSDFVEQFHAPIVDCGTMDQRLMTYDPEQLTKAVDALSGEVELALIDGPPAHLFGRSGTMESILPHLSPGGVVLLDDACRPHEYGLCGEWRSRFRRQLRWVGIVPVGHGIAVFSRR